jgi:NAD(P)-dependent dehydrogenase (short-subunit alcohol dehydrogenase family)
MGKVWFITGAGRGMGVDIAKAALGAGHKVVATGRNTDKAAQAVGTSAGLLVVRLDVTKPTDAESAVNLDHSRSAVLESLRSPESKRGHHRHRRSRCDRLRRILVARGHSDACKRGALQ